MEFLKDTNNNVIGFEINKNEELKTIQKILIIGANKRLNEINNERISYCNQNNFYDIELQKEYEGILELKRRYKSLDNIVNDENMIADKIGKVIVEKIQQALIGER